MDLEGTFALKEWFKRCVTKHIAKFGFCWTGAGCWNCQFQSLEEAGGPCIWRGPAPALQVSVLGPVRPPWGQDFLGYQTGEELGTLPKTFALSRL